MNAISVKDVTKQFNFKTQKGLKGFLNPVKKSVTAVDNISFEVQKGESVAFIGPNGAGKSTTIKMLSGILQPTAGQMSVIGFEPLRQRRQLAMVIGTVFGQRSQLVFNLPLMDSFELSAAMYRVPKAEVKARIAKLIVQFDLAAFIEQPVRRLSLGQRMRAEVANALLHNPQIIFLDEPTIGLDIVAKRALRQVIKDINKQLGTTVFLTSHDAGDIEAVCQRTMIVNHGRIMLDAKTAELKTDYLRSKSVSIVPEGALQPLRVAGIQGKVHNGRLVFDVDITRIPLKIFMQTALDEIEIADITIEDTPLEDIIHELYTRDKTHVAL